VTGFESFVGIDPWTALFTFCNMMITFAVLKKFLFKPVKKMIDDRQTEIDTMYADADAAKQKAAELEQEYQQHLQSIRDERDTLLREATARAQKREEEIVGEARAEAAALRAAAEADIAQERKKAVNDLKNEIGGIAVDIAGKVVEREINETDHKALIDEFIRNVGDAS
jgi:F-type H+-transporting ATPase subunit b